MECIGHNLQDESIYRRLTGGNVPLRIAALEDKIIQHAVVTILHQIYEVDFKGFLTGSDPGAARIKSWTRWQWASNGSE